MVKFLNNLLFFFYLLLIFFTPVIMFHKTSELFEFNKMLFIYSMTIIILSIWIAKMIVYKKIIIKKTIFDIPILLFFFSQILSTFFSIDRHTSIFGYYGRFNGGLLSIVSYIVLYYAFVSNFYGKEAMGYITRILKTSLISSTIVILWGLPGKFGYDLTCYLFTGVINNNCWTEQFKPSERLFSTLGQPNWLGAYLAINFFIGVYFFFKQKSFNRYFIFYFLYLILNFTTILFTRSRSALFAIITGLVLFILLDLFILLRSYKKLSLLTVTIFFLIALFKTGIPKIDKFFDLKFYLKKLPISSHQLSNKSSISNKQPSNSNTITDSADIRRIVWKGAINLGLNYPFFGTGVETFAYAYYFTRPKEHNLTSEWDFIYNKAHNEYLNYFATTGFFGLSTYLLMIGVIIFTAIKLILNIKYQKSKIHIKNQKNHKNSQETIKRWSDQITNNQLLITNYQLLITSLFLAYFSILITNFFGFSTTTINLYFYLLQALILSLLNTKPISNFQFPISTNIISFTLWQKTLLFFLLPITLIGLIFPLTYFFADTNYALADNYQKIQQYPQAYFYLTKALSYKYEHLYEDKLATVLANLAFLYNLKENKQPAINQSIDQLIRLADFYNLKSIKASPKNVLYWKTRAKIYYIFYQIKPSDNYLKETIKALEKTISLAPTDPKNYYTYAMILSETKKEKEKALTIIEKAIQLKPDYRDSYFTKGLILKNLGRKEEAKKVFQYILEKINPNDEEVKRTVLQ